MEITVRLLATYRRYLPSGCSDEAGYSHQVPTGTRAGDVLTNLPFPPNEVYTFFVNGRHAERDEILQEGDILSVFPAVGGGA